MKINENEQLLLGIRGDGGGVPPPQQLLAEPAAGDPGGVPPPTNCWQMLLWGSGGGVPPLNQELRGSFHIQNLELLENSKESVASARVMSPVLLRKRSQSL